MPTAFSAKTRSGHIGRRTKITHSGLVVPDDDPPTTGDAPIYLPDGSWPGIAGRSQENFYDVLGAGVGGPTMIARIAAEGNTIWPSAGTWQWSGLDSKVESAMDNGIEVLIQISYVPKHLTDPSWTDKRVPAGTGATWDAFVGDWSDMALKVFNRYHKDGNAKASFINSSNYVRFYEIWNENNWFIFWQEGAYTDNVRCGPWGADKYAQLLQAVYKKGHEAMGDDIYISNGGHAVIALPGSYPKIGGPSQDGDLRVKSWLWMEDMCQWWKSNPDPPSTGGWHPYLCLDFVCTHSYWYPRPGNASTATPLAMPTGNAIWNAFANDHPMIHNVVTSHGGQGLKIWSTEVGFPFEQTAVDLYGVRRLVGGVWTSGDDERKFAGPTEGYDGMRKMYRIARGADAWPTGNQLEKWNFDPIVGGVGNRGHLRSGPCFYFSAQDFNVGDAAFYQTPFPHEEHMGLFDKNGLKKTGFSHAAGVTAGWPSGVKTAYDAYFEL